MDLPASQRDNKTINCKSFVKFKIKSTLYNLNNHCDGMKEVITEIPY